MELDRRAFLALAARAGLALPALPSLAACALRPRGPAGEPAGPFLHGVASGDPLADRVILWTRVTAPPGRALPVRWRLARDPELADVVAEGRADAAPERDHTVKVDAAGLEPARDYWYAFEAERAHSAIGHTRTLPAGRCERFRLAFASCANLVQGHFNAYAAIARRGDLDLVLHLGDYLYEYPNGVYGDGRALGRLPEPEREIVALADYRARHARYKRDPDLQALHAAHAMIAVWDDHEIANDAWLDGAQNHQPEEGDWRARRAAAVRAYREWMPVREAGMPAPEDAPHLYRAFRIGDLAELAMLDTRLAARSRQLGAGDPALADPARTLLGEAQERWLRERLVASQRDGVAWRLLGQQVLMAQVRTAEGAIRNPDAWDGYPAARARLLRRLREDAIDDVIVLTGDVHSSWAMEVAEDPFDPRAYDPVTGRGALAVELVAPAVSSSPPGRSPADAAAREAEYRSRLPHLRYVEFWHRGYVTLALGRERARAEWWHQETVDRPSREEHLAAAVEVERGRARLVAG